MHSFRSTLRRKLFWLTVIIGYQLTPLDVASDLLPVLGSIDDILVTYFGVKRMVSADALHAAMLQLQSHSLPSSR